MNGSFHQAEALLRTLPDVADCRIETDAAGGVLGVHVVPRTTPAPATLAQDVALFLATETDLRIVAAQVRVEAPNDEEVAAEALEELEYEGRVRLATVHVTFTEERSWAEVELELGPSTARGHAETQGAGAAPELVARACLEALTKLCGARVALRLAGVRRLTVGSEEVVSVVVQECAGRDERLHVGSARSDGDSGRAAAYAVLSSMNRRIGRILAAPPKLYRIG